MTRFGSLADPGLVSLGNSVPPHAMNDPDTHKLREKTTEDLCKWIAGWNGEAGRGHRLLGEHELQRRLRRPDAIRSWIAIGISLLAVALSVIFRFIP